MEMKKSLETMDEDDESSQEIPTYTLSADKSKNISSVDIKPNTSGNRTSPRLNDLRFRWPGSWQDGTRRSAFQPYKPTTVLTNLQRGNIPTETPVPEETDVGFHHRAGQGEITEEDIEQEGDVDALDSSGLSALMWASAYGQVPTVQLLLKYRALVDRLGNEGETALHYASAGGHSDVVRILLSEGARVNHADDVGNTALMYAAHGDHPHCTNELLLRGADITMTNLCGDSAFGLAVQRGSSLGITSKLEHLKDAGVGATWLSPVFKSPMSDFGYDIADFYNIEPLFGTIEDFDALKARADELGIKVILDFVPNHSSNESEWFKKSVQRIDPYTDYYVWNDGVPNAEDPSKRDPPNNWLSNFRGSAWEWNEQRQQYYLHQFGVGQPDLNYRSPALVEEMKSVLRHWLDRGVDGFRVDAVPYLFESESLADEPLSGDPTAQPGDERYLLHIYTQNQPETKDMVQQWRAVLDEYKAKDGKTRVMMAEVYAPLNETMTYFGTEERPGAHFPFNFQLISYININSTAKDIVYRVKQWEDNRPSFGWSNWVIGNHDNHRAATRLGVPLADAYNMLVQMLPGSAVTYNGEEIGMEDAYISWEDTVDIMALNAGPDRYMLFSRDPERTPFQWDDSKNAGFSSANKTWLPVNPDYVNLNLAKERKSANSHYKIYQHLTAARKLPASQHGALDIQALTENVLAFSRYVEGARSLAVVMNTGGSSATVDLTSLEGVKGLQTVLVASGGSRLHRGALVRASHVTVGPNDGVVLLGLRHYRA